MYLAFEPALIESPRDLTDKPNISRLSTVKKQETEGRLQKSRFLLFALCWLLSIYPFLSRMMETFGPNSIGDSEHQIISNADWSQIEAVCLAGVDPVSNQEIIAMDVFAVVGSFAVCLLALSKIFWLGIQRQHQNSRRAQIIRNRLRSQSFRKVPISTVLLVFIPVIAASQLWTLLRWRNYQAHISQAAGNQYVDGDWTFGQIAAVTIFVPVLVQVWFGWLYD